MKKYFIFILLVVAGLALVSCDKSKDQNNPENAQENTQNDPQTNPQDSTGSNPYPYLRLEDLSPLHLLPIAKAEETVTKMGFKGGWQTKNGEGFYLYVSDSKTDSIFLETDSAGIVHIISYQASKGVLPSDAKGWLGHIPEQIILPEKAAQLTGQSILAFFDSYVDLPQGENHCMEYKDYIAKLQDLSTGCLVQAVWGSPIPENHPDGYYGQVIMVYDYTNNKDFVILMLSTFYHKQREPEPVIDPTDN